MGSAPSDHEAKGTWFHTLRRYLEAEGTLDLVLRELPADARRAVEEPIVSAWYPETALQDALRVVRAVVCEGDAIRFERLLRYASENAIHKFFRILLRASSYRFVLKQVPAMWTRVHRGPARVNVEVRSDHVEVRYRDFPFFDDESYRLLTRAAYDAMLTVAHERRTVTLLGHGDDWLDVRVG